MVYSNGVLHHTPDTAGAISELYRVLRKGGVAKVMLYHRNSLNYWVEVILRRGLLHGDLFRGQSPEQIMSRCVEYSEHDAEPLVKVYSRREARALFKLFSEVEVEVEQNPLAIPDRRMPFARQDSPGLGRHGQHGELQGEVDQPVTCGVLLLSEFLEQTIRLKRRARDGPGRARGQERPAPPSEAGGGPS